MSLKHAILGFLSNHPQTGYDLQKKVEKTISHFWPSTQSQIYRSLRQMSEQALIVSEIQHQEERPNRKVYSITEKGKEELIDWLATPLDMPRHRNQFLVQLFFSRHIDIESIIANLVHYKAIMQERLDFLNSDEVGGMLNLFGTEVEKTLYGIIHKNGIKMLESEIEWTNDSIRELKKMRNEK